MQQRFLLRILLLAQHVLGTTMPTIRSSRVLYSGCCLWYFVLWFTSCWSGVELRVGRRWAVALHIVQRYRSPSTYPPQQQDTICCKYLSLTLLMMGKILPETSWADLIDQWIIVASSWFICITLPSWYPCFIDSTTVVQMKRKISVCCVKTTDIYWTYIYWPFSWNN